MIKDESDETALVPTSSPALTTRATDLVRRGLESIRAREPRVVRFPRDLSIGTLFIYESDHYESDHLLLNDEGEEEWEEAEARGDVIVPADKVVSLAVHPSVSDLSPLAALQPDDLQGLRLHDASTAGAVSNSSIRNVGKLTGLISLGVSGNEFTDESLGILRPLTSLKVLGLAWTKITDSGLPLMTHLHDLKELFLTSTLVTDAGLAHVEQLTQLESLWLGATNVTSVGLRHIRNLSSLRLLYLSETPVTDAGLAHLQGLLELRSLSIGPCVTGEGLQSLRTLPHLQELHLWQTRLHAEARARLQRALPNCSIRC